ncbi:GNAT family N-acetyltransferase [Streptomyces sp. NPDC059002]|uniref:GNAT family N-acetyltransferase n=1 Tax=Streptomyces sp. NPDC059002 TaxID=3346690 RepID=UPI00368323B0
MSRTLARAFAHDPMLEWLLPDEGTRSELLARYFTALHDLHYGPHGRCETTGGGAAFWFPPKGDGAGEPGPELLEKLGDVFGDQASVLQDSYEVISAETPSEPHWYLAVIGSDPAARGQGHGAALLRSGLALADAAGAPAYLEASTIDTIPFYKHFGFTVRRELRLPHGGVSVWPMWREAVPAR